MSDDVYRGSEPVDRLTHLCVEMMQPCDRDENADVKAIIFLQDGDRGGIQTHGYDTELDAVADLFIHMKAIFQANGKTLDFMALGDDGVTRT